MSVGEKDFVKEFEEMGTDRVRSDLMLGRFTGTKRSEARVWLERTDAANWQAKRKPDARPSLMSNQAIKKAIPYLAGAAFLILALSRLAHH
jgi:hypothetical protein